METTTNTTKIKKAPRTAAEDLGLNDEPSFQRESRVGLNIIRMRVGETKFFRVLDIGVRQTKRWGDIPYASLIDLKTGEEGIIWLDGALKYTFKEENLPGNFEIQKLEKVTADVEIDGKMQEKEVNQYNIWRLKDQ